MNFLTPEQIDKIINRISVLTMEGEIRWASIDVLDILFEIADKDDLVFALEQSNESIKENIKKDIRFLALKGYEKERIDNFIARKKGKQRELEKRISFVKKTQQRLRNRIQRFDPQLSRGWYVDFRLEEDKNKRERRYPLRLIIRKREVVDGITYEGGITFAVKSDTVAIDNLIDSSSFPVIYTLGILLKKEGRVLREPKQVYHLDLSGV